MSHWPDLVPWLQGSLGKKVFRFSSYIDEYRHGRGGWEWLLGFSQLTVTAISIKGKAITSIRAFMDASDRKRKKNEFVPLTKKNLEVAQCFRSGCIQVLRDVIRSLCPLQLCLLHVRVILGNAVPPGGKIIVCSPRLTSYQAGTSPPLPIVLLKVPGLSLIGLRLVMCPL